MINLVFLKDNLLCNCNFEVKIVLPWTSPNMKWQDPHKMTRVSNGSSPGRIPKMCQGIAAPCPVANKIQSNVLSKNLQNYLKVVSPSVLSWKGNKEFTSQWITGSNPTLLKIMQKRSKFGFRVSCSKYVSTNIFSMSRTTTVEICRNDSKLAFIYFIFPIVTEQPLKHRHHWSFTYRNMEFLWWNSMASDQYDICKNFTCRLCRDEVPSIIKSGHQKESSK